MNKEDFNKLIEFDEFKNFFEKNDPLAISEEGDTYLHLISKNINEDVRNCFALKLSCVLKVGVNIYHKNNKGDTFISILTNKRDIKLAIHFSYMHTESYFMELKPISGLNQLHYAFITNHDKIHDLIKNDDSLKLFLEKDDMGNLPWEYGSVRKYYKLLPLLYEMNLPIDIPDIDGNKFDKWICYGDRQDTYFLKKCVDIISSQYDMSKVLALYNSDSFDYFKYCIEKGCDVNFMEGMKHHVLTTICKEDDKLLPILKYLVENDITYDISNDKLLFHVSTYPDNDETIKYLIDIGASKILIQMELVDMSNRETIVCY